MLRHPGIRIVDVVQVNEHDRPVNKRIIIDKHYSEIKSDALFFSTIAEKAKEIENQL